MERFRKVLFKIQNLNLKVAMYHMVTAFKPRPFSNNLFKKHASNLAELRQRAAKFLQLEELKEFGNQVRVENIIDKKFQDKYITPDTTQQLFGLCKQDDISLFVKESSYL